MEKIIRKRQNVVLNKEKKSLIFSLTLGDGALYKSSPSQRNSTGYFACKHGWKQEDYLRWKAKLAEVIMDRPVNVRKTKSKVKVLNKEYDQYVFLIGANRFRSWREYTYPNNVKSQTKLLKHIYHYQLATALWFMDDGTVSTGYPNPTERRLKGKRICSGLVLYLGQCFREDAFECQNWFRKIFNVSPRLKWQNVKYKGAIKSYPELRFTVQDALVIWNNISYIVNEIPSMRDKFQKLEERSQRSDLLQPQMLPISESESKDIVRQVQNK